MGQRSRKRLWRQKVGIALPLFDARFRPIRS
jgi:hypothetical protein